MRWLFSPSSEPSAGGVLGVAHVGDTWHLAAVRREAGGSFTTVHEHRAEAGHGVLASVWAELSSGLDAGMHGWPVAYALSAGRALHRRVTLPPADVETTEQLVAVRAEVLLPGQADRVRHGWARRHPNPATPGDENAWVVLAPSSALPFESKTDDGAPTPRMSHAASFPVALAAATETDRTAIAVSSTQTTVVSTGVHGLADVHELDLGPGDGEAEWLAALGDVLSSQSVQSTAVWHITDGHDAVEQWSAALGIRGRREPEDQGATIARGAALAALNAERWPVVHRESSENRASSTGIAPRRWAVAAAALLIAFAFWVWSDLHAAEAIADAREQHDTLGDDAEAVSRQLRLLRQLELRPPLLLAIFDEVTDRDPAFAPAVVQYDADGDLEITGRVKSANQVSALVTVLGQCRTIASVRLRSQKRADKEVAYEIVATPSDRFFDAFAVKTDPPDAASATDEDETAEAAKETTAQDGSNPGESRSDHGETELETADAGQLKQSDTAESGEIETGVVREAGSPPDVAQLPAPPATQGARP